mmetsp:Transcript_53582/g.143316  ORF Transcript_53582/g.143316 Transcript_53582/m.143316 type:complete len:239 (+) Transcript_53582:659-1375(+)
MSLGTGVEVLVRLVGPQDKGVLQAVETEHQLQGADEQKHLAQRCDHLGIRLLLVPRLVHLFHEVDDICHHLEVANGGPLDVRFLQTGKLLQTTFTVCEHRQTTRQSIHEVRTELSTTPQVFPPLRSQLQLCCKGICNARVAKWTKDPLLVQQHVIDKRNQVSERSHTILQEFRHGLQLCVGTPEGIQQRLAAPHHLFHVLELLLAQSVHEAGPTFSPSQVHQKRAQDLPETVVLRDAE